MFRWTICRPPTEQLQTCESRNVSLDAPSALISLRRETSWNPVAATRHRDVRERSDEVLGRAHVLRFHVQRTGVGYQADFLTRVIAEGATLQQIPLVSYDREGSTAI